MNGLSTSSRVLLIAFILFIAAACATESEDESTANSRNTEDLVLAATVNSAMDAARNCTHRTVDGTLTPAITGNESSLQVGDTVCDGSSDGAIILKPAETGIYRLATEVATTQGHMVEFNIDRLSADGDVVSSPQSISHDGSAVLSQSSKRTSQVVISAGQYLRFSFDTARPAGSCELFGCLDRASFQTTLIAPK